MTEDKNEKLNFGDLPQQFTSRENSCAVIIPAGFDATSTWGKGADAGPAAITEASANMELYDIETQSEVYKRGICTLPQMDTKKPVEQMVRDVRKNVLEVLDENRLPVLIGGEHSVSIGAFQAAGEKFCELSILQLDAHSDLRDEYEGSKFNHACVMARAKQIAHCVQVGIRSMSDRERGKFANEDMFFAKDIHQSTEWMNAACQRLKKNVYITFDLDAFDPAIMPATGTPEPGGLGWYQTLEFLRKVFEMRNVVGFDVVELCPIAGYRAGDFLAAKLIYKMLSYKFELKI